jgi:hypothetical protein
MFFYLFIHYILIKYKLAMFNNRDMTRKTGEAHSTRSKDSFHS